MKVTFSYCGPGAGPNERNVVVKGWTREEEIGESVADVWKERDRLRVEIENLDKVRMAEGANHGEQMAKLYGEISYLKDKAARAEADKEHAQLRWREEEKENARLREEAQRRADEDFERGLRSR